MQNQAGNALFLAGLVVTQKLDFGRVVPSRRGGIGLLDTLLTRHHHRQSAVPVLKFVIGVVANDGVTLRYGNIIILFTRALVENCEL